jgi:IS605 OrfB family transposase
MIITRKIQVYVAETDKDLKKDYIHTVYTWRDYVRRSANIIVAHKFVQQNIRDFVYIKDDIQEKFYVKDIIKEGKGMSEQNTTYRAIAEICSGKIPSDIYSCLNQSVSHTFKETIKDKNNIPIPFSAKAIKNIHLCEEDNRYYFTLFGVPFGCALGRDRSNNRSIIERCISDEYKICSSSLQINDDKKKMFLLLCVDIPQKEVTLQPDKKLQAYLDVTIPIVATVEVKANKDYDSGLKHFDIGNKEEFLHRRLQIQAAVRRCQINNAYSVGGKGRKRKCQAIERWHKIERNYVETRMHQYSRKLIDYAIKYECGEIVLLNQTSREKLAKEQAESGDTFLLRNWSYFGLKDKIAYKAKNYGIKLTIEP